MKTVLLCLALSVSSFWAFSQAQNTEELIRKFGKNSLENGATPYSYCFGVNPKCHASGCSEVTVKTPKDSDVMVTIKTGDKVVRHAYIRSGNSYTFEMPNGTYQVFFYYGTGWNPGKVMKSTGECEVKGGFVTDEYFGKDDPQVLDNTILEYELILQKNGNFSTRPSDAGEAF
ncbi:MAG: hypothetical protein KBC43_02720 [Bacteroidales bacterium]|nr:hypothetical protein [Bacteroidales bacterium]